MPRCLVPNSHHLKSASANKQMGLKVSSSYDVNPSTGSIRKYQLNELKKTIKMWIFFKVRVRVIILTPTLVLGPV